MGADMKNESRGRKTTEQPPWKTTYVRKLSTTIYHLVIHFPRPTVIIMVAERKNCIDCWVNWAVGHNLSLSSSFSLWRHCHVILLILKLADSFCYFSLTSTEWKEIHILKHENKLLQATMAVQGSCLLCLLWVRLRDSWFKLFMQK